MASFWESGDFTANYVILAKFEPNHNSIERRAKMFNELMPSSKDIGMAIVFIAGVCMVIGFIIGELL